MPSRAIPRAAWAAGRPTARAAAAPPQQRCKQVGRVHVCVCMRVWVCVGACRRLYVPHRHAQFERCTFVCLFATGAPATASRSESDCGATSARRRPEHAVRTCSIRIERVGMCVSVPRVVCEQACAPKPRPAHAHAYAPWFTVLIRARPSEPRPCRCMHALTCTPRDWACQRCARAAAAPP